MYFQFKKDYYVVGVVHLKLFPFLAPERQGFNKEPGSWKIPEVLVSSCLRSPVSDPFLLWFIEPKKTGNWSYSGKIWLKVMAKKSSSSLDAK